jgi:hypothetical protein
LLLVAADTIRATTFTSDVTGAVTLDVRIPAVLYNAGEHSFHADLSCSPGLDELKDSIWVTVYSAGCLDAVQASDAFDLAPGESRAFNIVAHGFVRGIGSPTWDSQSDTGTFRLRMGAWTGDGPIPKFYSNSFVVTRP